MYFPSYPLTICSTKFNQYKRILPQKPVMENFHLSLNPMRVTMTQSLQTSIQRPPHVISWRKQKEPVTFGVLKLSPSQKRTPDQAMNILIQGKGSQMKGSRRFLI